MKRITSFVVGLALTLFTTLAPAASMTDFLENKLIDAIFRNTAYTMPTVLAVALFTAASACDASTVTEVTNANAYARVALNPSVSNWANTQNSGTAVSSGTSGTTSNSTTVTFPTATGSWGTINYFGIYDSATYGAGNLLFCAAVTTPQTINTGATPSFSAGSLTIQIDN